MYASLVIAFGIFVIGFGLYLYVRGGGAAPLVGSLLSIAGLVVVVVTIVAWLVPGFFFNIP
jgi:hypothetical protein